MLTLCACGRYEIEQSTAEYRKGNKPMCHAETCAKGHWYDSQGIQKPYEEAVERHDDG